MLSLCYTDSTCRMDEIATICNANLSPSRHDVRKHTLEGSPLGFEDCGKILSYLATHSADGVCFELWVSKYGMRIWVQLC
jgi:hypothetical protein